MAIHTSEAVWKKFEDAVASFCLLDDPFMTVVFQDSLACVDLVIQVILGNPNLHATKVVTQDTLKNLHGTASASTLTPLPTGRSSTLRFSVRRLARHGGVRGTTAAS